MVLTQGQRLKNQLASHPHRDDPSPSVNNICIDQGASNLKIGKDKMPFDFIQFCKESKIKISSIDYLKSHPSS